MAQEVIANEVWSEILKSCNIVMIQYISCSPNSKVKAILFNSNFYLMKNHIFTFLVVEMQCTKNKLNWSWVGLKVLVRIFFVESKATNIQKIPTQSKNKKNSSSSFQEFWSVIQLIHHFLSPSQMWRRKKNSSYSVLEFDCVI